MPASFIYCIVNKYDINGFKSFLAEKLKRELEPEEEISIEKEIMGSMKDGQNTKYCKNVLLVKLAIK